jgi:hypothetical protein
MPRVSPPHSFFVIMLTFVLTHIPLSKLIDAMHTDKIRGSFRLIIAGWLFVSSIVISSRGRLQFIYFEF